MTSIDHGNIPFSACRSAVGVHERLSIAHTTPSLFPRMLEAAGLSLVTGFQFEKAGQIMHRGKALLLRVGKGAEVSRETNRG